MNDSLYDATYESDESRLNLGYNYRNLLLSRVLSSRLFLNDTLNGFLAHIQTMVVNGIDDIKHIKTMYNITVDKDDKKIN